MSQGSYLRVPRRIALCLLFLLLNNLLHFRLNKPSQKPKIIRKKLARPPKAAVHSLFSNLFIKYTNWVSKFLLHTVLYWTSVEGKRLWHTVHTYMTYMTTAEVPSASADSKRKNTIMPCRHTASYNSRQINL
jgi:hypothetical protein